ncbi:hypothetical protein ACQ4M3_29045 [Leptolyngbya sp. AN03gr2]|uniref:hypothetical protein n=1 Tax=unclassified Leptolyngbya TaxID=2650499 RepID=UPI003D322B48
MYTNTRANASSQQDFSADDLLAEPVLDQEQNYSPQKPAVQNRASNSGNERTRIFQRPSTETDAVKKDPARKNQTPPAVQPSNGNRSPASTLPAQQDALEPLPASTVALMPASSSLGFIILSTLIKTVAGTAAAPVITPLIYLTSPLVTPLVGLAIIGITHHQGWIRARTISICALLGWTLSLPFAPIFLIPIRDNIPALESLTTPRQTSSRSNSQSPSTPAEPF